MGYLASLVAIVGCAALEQAQVNDGGAGTTSSADGAVTETPGGDDGDDGEQSAGDADSGTTGAPAVDGAGSSGEPADSTGSSTGTTGESLAESGGSTTGGSTTGEVSYPESCAALAQQQPNAVAGEHDLFVDGNPSMPWSAYCVDLDSTPRTYLTLGAAPGANFSQYTAGGASQGTDVRTTFTRVRINPGTLKVDTADKTFSMSTGSLMHSGTNIVTSMPYATAMSCIGNLDSGGVARIDLSGTPFVVDQEFCFEGAASSGTAVEFDDGRVVEISGGGFCGWGAPNDPACPFGPYNDNSEALVGLRYQP